MLMKDNYFRIKNAYSKYNSDSRPDLEQICLKSLYNFIIESKDEITKLINAYNYEFTFEDLIEIYNQSTKSSDFKKKISIEKLSNNFISSIINTASGIIYYEAVDVLDTFKTMLECVKNRDGLVIARFDEDEYDFVNYLIMIFRKVFEALNIDTDLFLSFPYEECDFSLCDVKICNYYEISAKRNKDFSNDYIIYVEDNSFMEIANNDLSLQIKEHPSVRIITGKVEDVLSELNEKRYNAVSIYTKEPKIAYRMINEVHSDNVLINTSLSFARHLSQENNIFVETKHIMYKLEI